MHDQITAIAWHITITSSIVYVCCRIIVFLLERLHFLWAKPTEDFFKVEGWDGVLAFICGVLNLLSILGFWVGVAGLIAAKAMSLIETGSTLLAAYLVIFAFLLYGLRTRFPFLYGFIELVVGIATIVYILLISPPLINNSNAAAESLSIASGIYVIVRGLDNMNKSIPKSLEHLWLLLRWYTPTKG